MRTFPTPVTLVPQEGKQFGDCMKAAGKKVWKVFGHMGAHMYSLCIKNEARIPRNLIDPAGQDRGAPCTSLIGTSSDLAQAAFCAEPY